MLIIPAQRSKAELDAWLEKGVASAQTNVNTYGITHDRYQQGIQSLVLIFIGLESVIAIVAAMALATLNYIFFSERQEEFGILNAMGRSRLWLVLRTAKETGSGVALAWLMGAAVCGLGLVCAQAMLYTPLGLNLNLINPMPWLFTLPIPLVVVAASTGTIARMLSKLDPVSLIERR